MMVNEWQIIFYFWGLHALVLLNCIGLFRGNLLLTHSNCLIYRGTWLEIPLDLGLFFRVEICGEKMLLRDIFIRLKTVRLCLRLAMSLRNELLLTNFPVMAPNCVFCHDSFEEIRRELYILFFWELEQNEW